MKKIYSLLLVATVFAFSGCVGGSGSGSAVPGEDTGKDINDIGALRFIEGQAKVAVPFYKVKYLTKELIIKDKDTKAETSMSGINENTFDELTNLAYKDLNKKLLNAGFEVMSLDEVQNLPSYASLKSKVDSEEDGLSVLANGTKEADVGNFSSSVMSLYKEANTVMLSADYTLHYASRDTSGGFVLDRRDHIAQPIIHVTGKVDVGGFASGAVLQGSMKFSNVPYSKVISGEWSNETTTSGVVLDWAKNWWKGGRDKSAIFVLKANPSKYKEAALESLYNANSVIVKELKAAR